MASQDPTPAPEDTPQTVPSTPTTGTTRSNTPMVPSPSIPALSTWLAQIVKSLSFGLDSFRSLDAETPQDWVHDYAMAPGGPEAAALPLTAPPKELETIAVPTSTSSKPVDPRAAIWEGWSFIDTEALFSQWSNAGVVIACLLGIIVARIWMLPYWFVPLFQPDKGIAANNMTFSLFYEPWAVIFSSYGNYITFWALTGNNAPKLWTWFILGPAPLMFIENICEMAGHKFPIPFLQLIVLATLLGSYPGIQIIQQQKKHKQLIAEGASVEEIARSDGVIKAMQKSQGIATCHISFVLFCLAYLCLFFAVKTKIQDPSLRALSQIALQLFFVMGEPLTMFIIRRIFKPSSRILRFSYFWVRCHADLFANAVLPSVSSPLVFAIMQIFMMYPIFKHLTQMTDAYLRLAHGSELPFDKKHRIRRSECVILFYEFLIECMSVFVYIHFVCLMRYSTGLNGYAPLYVSLSDAAFARSLIYSVASCLISGMYSIFANYWVAKKYGLSIFSEGANVVRRFILPDLLAFVMAECVLMAFLVDHVGVWPYVAPSELQSHS